jgi:hypothetical protein
MSKRALHLRRRELLQQRLRSTQVTGVEALGKPAVDRSEKFSKVLIPSPLIAPHSRAMTSAAAPVIGFLHQGSLPPLPLRSAFRKGLVEAGMSEGPSVAIEDRWADGQYDRLPALAADCAVGLAFAFLATHIIALGIATLITAQLQMSL